MRNFSVIAAFCALCAYGCLQSPPPLPQGGEPVADGGAVDTSSRPTDASGLADAADAFDPRDDGNGEDDLGTRDAADVADVRAPDCSFPGEVVLWDFRSNKTLQNQGTSAARLPGYDLTADGATPAWNATENALLTNEETKYYRYPIESGRDTLELLSAAQEADGLTIEVWLQPEETQPDVDTPGRRIVTWSDGTCRRNTSLIWEKGPDDDYLAYRYRHAEVAVADCTSANCALNGTPEHRALDVSLPTNRFTHLTLTIDEADKSSSLYVDGEAVTATPAEEPFTPGADFLDAWDATHRIFIGDETAESEEGCPIEPRNLYAEWKLVALYAGALTPADAQRLHSCRTGM